MIVSLFAKNRIHSIVLPEKVRGQYWLCAEDEAEIIQIASIEEVHGEWNLKGSKNVKIIAGKDEKVLTRTLEKNSLYELRDMNTFEKMFVFTEEITEDRQVFQKYWVEEEANILIGRKESSAICISNPFVSGEHARLRYSGGNWIFSDLQSTNGTFVNGMRVKELKLTVGDTIYMMGVRIIIGVTFIAINNPDQTVCIKTDHLRKVEQKNIEGNGDDEENESHEIEYFYRSPRFKREIETATFRVDSPPGKATGSEMPFILAIGPSVTMGMASMSTAIFAITNGIASGNMRSVMPSVVMSISMLLGTLLWPTLSKRFEKKNRIKKEALRQEKYREYLEKLEERFEKECRKQEGILQETFVSIEDCIERIESVKRNLWERGIGQNDFLKVRVGIGEGVLDAQILYSERKFDLNEDNLQEELYALCEKPKVLHRIPIALSLHENYVTGVIGERKKIIEFAKGLIFQLTALYSYDEVKLVFLYDPFEAKEFEFTRWLPHVWNEEKSFRFIATDHNELKEVSAYIEKEIADRSELKESERAEKTPCYVIFALSRNLSMRAEMLKQVYSRKENLNISVISFFDELRNLPKECTTVVELENLSGKIFDRNDISGNIISFYPDVCATMNAEKLSRRLSNIYLDSSATFDMPKMITFLRMFEVGNVEHLNSLMRWQENDPTKSLQTEVGIDTTGELFKLDLHEKFHGPHGLVAGMTGSGKSEFIITFILSLAVNYHPHEVAFILIDYKGGGMAKSFENLPHVAGIITNLDGAAIKRSLISIESELKRRQAIFAQVSKEIGVSNIDIYKYQSLYREGKVQEPLQHLFIISDEFAELKTQQPEFMEQLVSGARIGRSLGVHLILATQKPSGVVDDQIWSNSKFRVCLKVQERADSMDMLKRPDAAELTLTGRFYLQVGYNELFEMGQSAWAGASYMPSDKVLVEKDNSVVAIDRNGRVIREAKPSNGLRSLLTQEKKQLDVITDYLKNIAEEENIKVRSLWLEPIPAVITLEQLQNKYQSNKEERIIPLIGEYDDPVHQRQCPLYLPLISGGNTIIYGSAGSGKTTFLNTMIYSLITNYTPEDVNLYILDFGAETLRSFAKAPHIGDVILSYEAEKISSLFRQIQGELERRKKLFADYGGDYELYYEATNQKMPTIIITIHNFTVFRELYEEKEDAVQILSREGIKYGIYFILTALGASAIRFRLLQNFKQFFILQMNDETDYSTVLGKTDGLCPSKYKGRGLVKLEEVHEFQTAQITEKVSYQFVQEQCRRLDDEWNGAKAQKVPILPDQVDEAFLSDHIDTQKPWMIPIGVERNSLQVSTYPFGKHYINMVLSDGNECYQFGYDLANFIAKKYAYDVTFFDIKQEFVEKEKAQYTYIAVANEAERKVAELFDTTVKRNNAYKEAQEAGEKLPIFETLFIVIHSLENLYEVLSKESGEKLQLILEKGDANYQMTFVLAEKSTHVAKYSYTTWYKQHVLSNQGIWLGNGIKDQYYLKISKTTAEMHEELPFGFGYSVFKGKATKVKMLCSKMEEEV